MAGTITTGSFAKDLKPVVNKWYGLKYAEYPQEYKDLFEIFPSGDAFEEDVGTLGFGLAQVIPEGRSVAYDSTGQGFITRYTHVEYGLGFIVTRNMRDDGKSVTKSIASASRLAFSMRQTKEIVCANVYNNAFSDTYPGGDGKAILAHNHPNKSGGTWRNELAAAADLSENSLEQACIDISKFATDKGLKIAVKPLSLNIPVELEFDAVRILKSILQSNSANNDINAIRSLGKIPQGIKVNNYFDDDDAWFLKTNCPDGMKYFNRRDDDFDTDNDFDTSNIKFKATMRFSCGNSDPRGLFGSPGI